MKKMKLSLANIIVKGECYKRKCKNVSKLLSFVNFFANRRYSSPKPHHRSFGSGSASGSAVTARA